MWSHLLLSTYYLSYLLRFPRQCESQPLPRVGVFIVVFCHIDWKLQSLTHVLRSMFCKGSTFWEPLWSSYPPTAGLGPTASPRSTADFLESHMSSSTLDLHQELWWDRELAHKAILRHGEFWTLCETGDCPGEKENAGDETAFELTLGLCLSNLKLPSHNWTMRTPIKGKEGALFHFL